MSAINNSFKPMDPDLLGMRMPQVGPKASPIDGGSMQTNDVKGGGFIEALQNSMQEVNADQLRADNSIKDIVAGKSKNIHETMLEIQKAELSLKTMMQVRNKILEAYKEIIRMQV